MLKDRCKTAHSAILPLRSAPHKAGFFFEAAHSQSRQHGIGELAKPSHDTLRLYGIAKVRPRFFASPLGSLPSWSASSTSPAICLRISAARIPSRIRNCCDNTKCLQRSLQLIRKAASTLQGRVKPILPPQNLLNGRASINNESSAAPGDAE